MSSSRVMELFMSLMTRHEPLPPCNITVPLLYYTLATYLVSPAHRTSLTTPDVSDSRHDYVVVGGGTAGCVLARRLAEQGRRTVLLLEAGGEEPDIAAVPAFYQTLWDSDVDWSYHVNTDTLTGNKVWHAGRALGGTSAIGNMLYLRGNKKDYDEWQNLGNVGWGYSNVLPYFKKSETVADFVAKMSGFHGTDGPLSVQKFPYEDDNIHTLEAALFSAGFKYVDVNGKTQDGMMRLHATQRNGRRVSTCRAFLQRDRPNIVVKLRSRVTKVLFDSYARQAIGVEYISGVNVGKPVRAYANTEVILTAGVVGSAQLLMLSGIGPRKMLEKLEIPVVQDLPVGQNIYDAPEIPLIKFQLKKPAAQVPDDVQGFFLDLSKYVKGRGPLTTPGPSEFTVFIKSSLANATNDVPDILLSLSTRLVSTDVASVTMPDEPNCPPSNTTTTGTIPCYYDQLIMSPVVLRPRSKGSISIVSTDPLTQPTIRADYLKSERDIKVAIEGVWFAQNLSRNSELLKAGFSMLPIDAPHCRDWPVDSERWWRCSVLSEAEGSIWGAVGSCRMGPPSDPAAVVDPRLRVRGVKGLRVADAAVVPSPIGGGALATAIMIAEKCADMINEEWCEVVAC